MHNVIHDPGRGLLTLNAVHTSFASCCIKLAQFPFGNTSQALKRPMNVHSDPAFKNANIALKAFLMIHEAKESGRSQSRGAQTPHQRRRHEQAVPLLPGSPVYKQQLLAAALLSSMLER
eukprot:scpid95031/ scgid1315/ 